MLDTLRIVIVHNEYARFSGEEAAVQTQAELLVARGHEVFSFVRGSAELETMILGKARAFCSGIYSLASRRAMRRYLARTAPDLVHVHNVFPLISPSVLGVCAASGIPVVMTVHNYRLICPNGLHMPKHALAVCERCCGGREYWCVLRNCEGSAAKSVGYALRNYIARKMRLFTDHVTLFVCLTDFQKQRLTAEGYPPDRIAVVPNMVAQTDGQEGTPPGEYAGFIGRVSAEKGIHCLLDAARLLPQIQFRMAGSYHLMPEVIRRAGSNVRIHGQLSRAETDSLYRHSRLIVLPSVWFEAFPLVLVEAMLHGKPVVASRIGGIPEIVAEGVTGLLFEPGNARDLAERIQYLWDRPRLCLQMGRAAREKALQEYSPEKFYERLMNVYRKAVLLRFGSRNAASS